MKEKFSWFKGEISACRIIILAYIARLISAEDVRNYLSHIIYILIFDFFLNFLSFVRLQHLQDVGGRYLYGVREASEI